MNPFFSIIIPTYNREHILPKTIKSVVNQNFNDWELIVVDDGSTDKTKDLINDFSKNDNRIKYIYQDNQERSAARNNGIKKSKGKYVCFLDSDDEYLPIHLEIFFKEIKRDNYPKAMYFSSLTIYKNGVDVNHPIKKLNNKNSIYDYLFNEGIYPCRVCIERSILNEFKFKLDCNMVEDTFLWLEIASKYPIFQILKKTVNYYQHEENSVNKKFNPCEKMLKAINSFKSKNGEIYFKISRKLRYSIKSDLYYGVGFSKILNYNRFSALLNMTKSLFFDLRNEKTKHKMLIIFSLTLFRKLSTIRSLIEE